MKLLCRKVGPGRSVGLESSNIGRRRNVCHHQLRARGLQYEISMCLRSPCAWRGWKVRLCRKGISHAKRMKKLVTILWLSAITSSAWAQGFVILPISVKALLSAERPNRLRRSGAPFFWSGNKPSTCP